MLTILLMSLNQQHKNKMKTCGGKGSHFSTTIPNKSGDLMNVQLCCNLPERTSKESQFRVQVRTSLFKFWIIRITRHITLIVCNIARAVKSRLKFSSRRINHLTTRNFFHRTLMEERYWVLKITDCFSQMLTSSA